MRARALIPEVAAVGLPDAIRPGAFSADHLLIAAPLTGDRIQEVVPDYGELASHEPYAARTACRRLRDGIVSLDNAARGLEIRNIILYQPRVQRRGRPGTTGSERSLPLPLSEVLEWLDRLK